MVCAVSRWPVGRKQQDALPSFAFAPEVLSCQIMALENGERPHTRLTRVRDQNGKLKLYLDGTNPACWSSPYTYRHRNCAITLVAPFLINATPKAALPQAIPSSSGVVVCPPWNASHVLLIDPRDSAQIQVDLIGALRVGDGHGPCRAFTQRRALQGP